MASTAQPITQTPPPLPAVQRYFEVSLFLLVATGLLAIVSTGKLDIFLDHGITSHRARQPQRPCAPGTPTDRNFHRASPPGLVHWPTSVFFPFDIWVLSRDLAQGAPNPALYAALLAAVHLLIFAALVRLFSARTNRDYAFLAVLAVPAMLASAILTVETGFLIALAIFPEFWRSPHSSRSIFAAARPARSHRLPFDAGSPTALQLNRALGIHLRFLSP